MPSSKFFTNKSNLVGRPTNSYRRSHSKPEDINEFRRNNIPNPSIILEAPEERGCDYHGPRAHHTTAECRRRIRLLIEERRREHDLQRRREHDLQRRRERLREEMRIQEMRIDEIGFRNQMLVYLIRGLFDRADPFERLRRIREEFASRGLVFSLNSLIVNVPDRTGPPSIFFEE